MIYIHGFSEYHRSTFLCSENPTESIPKGNPHQRTVVTLVRDLNFNAQCWGICQNICTCIFPQRLAIFLPDLQPLVHCIAVSLYVHHTSPTYPLGLPLPTPALTCVFGWSIMVQWQQQSKLTLVCWSQLLLCSAQILHQLIDDPRSLKGPTHLSYYYYYNHETDAVISIPCRCER